MSRALDLPDTIPEVNLAAFSLSVAMAGGSRGKVLSHFSPPGWKEAMQNRLPMLEINARNLGSKLKELKRELG